MLKYIESELESDRASTKARSFDRPHRGWGQTDSRVRSRNRRVLCGWQPRGCLIDWVQSSSFI